MGNKSGCWLLSFLLSAALCLEAFILEGTAYCPTEKMNWTQARLYCQKHYIDMVTWSVVDRLELTQGLINIRDEQVWIGLFRDPEKDSVWKWINVTNGEGIPGQDLSQSSFWADGQQSSHCAFVDEDLKWYSKRCSSRHNFYCSEESKIEHHEILHDWQKASQDCKTYGSNDLATIRNTDTLLDAGWIGLYRVAGETWNWIGNQPSDYRNWAQGEPLTADCGSFHPVNEKWHSTVCSKELRFVCYDDSLVLVNDNKTWEDALEHCRSMVAPCQHSFRHCRYRHELLSLKSSSHYNYIRNRIRKATTDEVWTGLRFLGGNWWWTNGESLEDEGVLPDCPSKYEHCGALSKNNTKQKWIFRDCSEQRNFICYREKVFFTEDDSTELV